MVYDYDFDVFNHKKSSDTPRDATISRLFNCQHGEHCLVTSNLINGISNDRKIDQFVPPYGNETTVGHFEESVINYAMNHRSEKPSTLRCKLVLIGDVAVGKSSLARRLCYNAFDRNYKTTIGVDFEVERFLILGVPISLQIWDTAGQERFKCIAAAYYRGAHVIMGVFDLSNLETLVSAERWIKEALEITAADNPIVFLIGSKQDLISDEKTFNHIEQVVRSTAKRLNAEYWPVSSLTGYQVHEFFRRVACVSFQILIKQQQNPLDKSIPKTPTKTQLAVSFNSVNGYISPKQSNANCCNV